MDGLWSEDETPPEREAVQKPPRSFGGALKSRRDRSVVKVVPDAAPGRASEITFTELVRCASCGRMAPGGDAPARHKAAAWLRLAADHAPECRWIATRGYTDK